MVRISKIILYITLALIALWQLPWCYSFFTAEGTRYPFTLYSTLNENFVSLTYEEEKGLYGKDNEGNTYTREQVDSLLPFFYMTQLVSQERFPKEIKGTPVTPRSVQLSNFIFRSRAYDINTNKIELYPLMESKSNRVELEMPEDVFRLTDNGVEFIVMKTNTLNEQKSERFTKAMKDKGFVFPNQLISGNPTTRKDYDEGYLVTDSEGKLFHLKKVVGRPYVRHIPLPDSVKISQLFITEFKNRKTLAFIVDKSHKLYVLNSGSYELDYTGIDSYIPTEHSLTVFGNMLDWTVIVERDESIDYYALDATTHSIIKEMKVPTDYSKTFSLHFTSFKDTYVKPRLN